MEKPQKKKYTKGKSQKTNQGKDPNRNRITGEKQEIGITICDGESTQKAQAET